MLQYEGKPEFFSLTTTSPPPPQPAVLILKQESFCCNLSLYITSRVASVLSARNSYFCTIPYMRRPYYRLVDESWTLGGESTAPM